MPQRATQPAWTCVSGTSTCLITPGYPKIVVTASAEPLLSKTTSERGFAFCLRRSRSLARAIRNVGADFARDPVVLKAPPSV
jgi:hypothetical protein